MTNRAYPEEVEGTKYMVVESCVFDRGDIVILEFNDGSNCPRFSPLGSTRVLWEQWSNMKPLRNQVALIGGVLL